MSVKMWRSDRDYVAFADYARLKAAADAMAKVLQAAESVGYEENGDLWPDARAALAAYQEATR